MTISSISATYSKATTEADQVRQLEQQKQRLQVQIEQITAGKEDAETKAQRIALIESQITLVDARISRLNQQAAAAATSSANSGASVASTASSASAVSNASTNAAASGAAQNTASRMSAATVATQSASSLSAEEAARKVREAKAATGGRTLGTYIDIAV